MRGWGVSKCNILSEIEEGRTVFGRLMRAVLKNTFSVVTTYVNGPVALNNGSNFRNIDFKVIP